MRRLLIHVVDSDPRRAARVASNALSQLEDTSIDIVAQGAAVDALKAPARWLGELPRSCRVLACANSLSSLGLDASELDSAVTVVPSAAAHLAEGQWAGAAYVRI